MRRVALPATFALLVTIAAPAHALPVDASAELVPQPDCNLPLPPSACIAAFRTGPGSLPGDDHVEVSLVLAHLTVGAIVPGAPSAGVVLDHNETYIANPLFPEIEDVFIDLNDTLPPPLTPYVSFHAGTAYSPTESYQGFWIRIDPCSAVPITNGPCAINPGFWYEDGFIGRDRIYPLADGGTGPAFDTDAERAWATDLLASCLPEETAFVPAICAPQADLAQMVSRAADALVPDVTIQDGVQHAEGRVNPPGMVFVGQAAAQRGLSSPESRANRPEHGPLSDAGLRGLRENSPTHALDPPSQMRADLDATPGPSASAVALVPSREPPLLAVAGMASAVGAIAVALYRRLRRGRLLEQPTRRALMETVQASPGLTPAAIAKRLAVSYKTALHHVDVLVEDGLLTVRLVGRQRRLFPASAAFGQAERERHVVLQRPGVQRLMQSLAHGEPVARRELAAQTGLGRTALWSSVCALQDAGILAAEGKGLHATVRLVSVSPADPPVALDASA